MERTAQRKGSFKKTLDAGDARNKRMETSSELRKGKREENLMKKRREGITEVEEEVVVSSTSNSVKAASISELVAGLNSASVDIQYDSCHKIRKLLSIEKSPPIDEVIKAGCVSRFIHFLALNDNPKLQFEAAWALTNIASGSSDQTKVVIDSGAIPYFVQLLLSGSDEVREQAVWAIGNISGDGPNGRDQLLNYNAMNGIIHVLTTSQSSLQLVRTATWTLSNLCRGKPQPNFSKVAVALPLLVQLLAVNDVEVQTDAAWACSYLSDGDNSCIQAVIENNIPAQLVRLLASDVSQVNTPALRAVGNIVTGTDQQTQVMLNCGFLPHMLKFLSSAKKSVRKEAAWVLSNVTASSTKEIQAVIDANLVPALINLMQVSDHEVRREAAWSVSNAISGGSNAQIAFLVKQGCIKPLCDVLDSSDIKIVAVALEAIENILKAGAKLASKTNGTNPYSTLVEECDGLDKIDELQQHANSSIYSRATAMLEQYFDAEEENNTPNVSSNGYSFTSPANTGMTFSF